MNKEIWKYILRPIITLDVPAGSQILSVQEQFGEICIWMLVDPTLEKEERRFEVYGTGHPINYDMGTWRTYIGTVKLENGSLIMHIFENIGI